MEKLTCTQAKQIDLVEYLSSLGHHPKKIMNQDHWYLSPLRDEKTPSFKVNRKQNIWYDHGIGMGGDLITFGTRYFKCSVSDLLNRLTTHKQSAVFSIHPPLPILESAGEKKEVSSGKILILQSRPLVEKKLIYYLEERKISIPIATQFCNEVDFILYGKKQTVIGFPNVSGGYELRSASFKGSSAPKDISLIENSPGKKSISVLEGFTDFLSLISLGEDQLQQNFLILNSLSFASKSIDILKSFDEVLLYLDQDTPGKKATTEFLSVLPHATDASLFYSGRKVPSCDGNPIKHLEI